MQTTVSSIFTVGNTASACACRPAIAASMVTAARRVLARKKTQVMLTRV